MKFKKMFSCFVAFVLICCNLVVSTCSAKLPSSYPVFKFDLELDNNVAPYPWCYILMYNQSSNDYELYIIFNDYEFYNETSLSCYYSSSSSSFGETLINSNFGKEEPKSFSFTLYGNTWNLIDWSVVAPYRSTIRTITIIVNYYWFIQKTIKRIPGVIGGFSSD